MSYPFEVWLGNLASYTEGNLEGRWISFPLPDDELERILGKISRNGQDETIIMDVSIRPDCAFMEEMIGEWSSPKELNTIAKLIGEEEHPVAGAFCAYAAPDTLEELGNLLVQEDGLPFERYSFNGSDNQEVLKSMSEEEKYGYTVLENSPDFHVMENLEIGTSTLMQYIDVEAIGRDAVLNGYVHLYPDGFIQNGAECNLSLYTMQELKEMVSAKEPGVQEPAPEKQVNVQPVSPRI